VETSDEVRSGVMEWKNKRTRCSAIECVSASTRSDLLIKWNEYEKKKKKYNSQFHLRQHTSQTTPDRTNNTQRHVKDITAAKPTTTVSPTALDNPSPPDAAHDTSQ